ncbi:MAG: hypothetical protein AAF804_02585, partial [Bacteroidota bacterium]
MSISNQLERTIRDMNEAAFGKLCTGFFHAQHVHVVDDGNVKGKEKTRAGMPDAYLREEDGSYSFFQYTTTQSRGALSTKLIKDIDDCFLPSRDLPSPDERRIKRIFLCFNESVSILNQEQLRQHLATHSKGIELELIDIDRLVKAMVLDNRYAPLIRNELSISLDSGQLLTAQAFQAQYESTLDGIKLPLSYPLVAREAELEKGLQFLAHTDLLLLSGQAGVGKTRLGLALGKAYAAQHPEYEFRVIDFSEAHSLIEDLRTYLFDSKAYVILVDDINRLLPPIGDEAAFQTVFELLRPNRPAKVKLICTVREHAMDQVRSKVGMCPHETLPLSSVDSRGIRAFLKRNFKFREDIEDQILRLAQGNFRLAVMAGRKALATNDLHDIHTSADLFTAFFKDVDLEPLDWHVLSITALFQSVDWQDASFWAMAQNAFGLEASVDEIKATIKRLYHQELLTQQGSIVKIEDQVFASYVLFRSMVQDRTLDLYGYFSAFFGSESKTLLQDALIPLLNYFDQPAVIAVVRPAMERYWREIENRPEAALLFWQSAWFFLPETCLAYLYGLIKPLPAPETVLSPLNFEALRQKGNPYLPGQDATLQILLDFCRRPYAHFEFAVELVFLYLERRPKNVDEVCVFFREEMDFRIEDVMRLEYLRQAKFLAYFTDQLDQESLPEISRRVLLSVIPIWFKTQFQESTSFDRNTIYIRDGRLPLTDSLETFRTNVWQTLFQVFALDPQEAIKALRQYPPQETESNRAIIAKDLALLLPFIHEKLDPLDNEHALWVQERLIQRIAFFSSKQEEGENEAKEAFVVDKVLLERVKERFTNEAVQLYTLLHVSASERRSWSREDWHTHAPVKARIRAFFSEYELEDYRQFLATFEQVSTQKGSSWADPKDVSYIFEHLLETQPELGLSVVEMALQRGNTVKIGSYKLIPSVLKAASGVEKAFRILNQPNNPHQLGILFAFLYAAPSDKVPIWVVKEVLEVLQHAQNAYLYLDLASLIDYERIHPGFWKELLDKVASKAKAYPSFSFDLNWDNLIEDEECIRGLDHALLSQFYLATRIPRDCSSENLTVYSDQAILSYFLTFDPQFIAKLIDACLEKCRLDAGHLFKHAPLSFIWELAQAEEVATFALQAFKSYFHLVFEHPAVWLFKGVHDDSRPEILLHRMLQAHAQDASLVKMLFNVINHVFPEKKRLAFLDTWLHTD